MSRKIVFHLSTGFAGMDSWDFWEFPDHVTSEELDQTAWELALNNAESFGIYLEEQRPEEDDAEDDCFGDSYSDNIEGYWEDYDPEKHDGHRICGDDSWQQA